MLEVKGVTCKAVRNGDRWVQAQVIQCGYCDAELPVFHRKSSGAMPPEALKAKAKHSGWQWSANGKHACKDCIRKFKALSAKKATVDDLAAVKPEEAGTAMATAILSAAKDKLAQTEPASKECRICHQVKPLEAFTLSKSNKTDGRHSFCRLCNAERSKLKRLQIKAKDTETPPPAGEEKEMHEVKLREMSREDRRNVWRAIDENYDDVNQRYVGKATDASIALGLSVPRAWVTTIREADFGPAGSNEEMADVAKSLSDLSKSLEETMELALNVAAKAETLTKNAASLRKRVEDIEKSVGPRRTS